MIGTPDSHSRTVFGQLHDLARERGLKLLVVRAGTARGQALLRIVLKAGGEVRYSSARPAAVGIALNRQASLLAEVLRGRPA